LSQQVADTKGSKDKRQMLVPTALQKPLSCRNPAQRICKSCNCRNYVRWQCRSEKKIAATGNIGHITYQQPE